MKDQFRIFAGLVSKVIGSGWAFIALLGTVLTSGLYYNFSEQWKTNASLVIAVLSLSILIFLQRSQNFGDKATHVKLDELINATSGARNAAASVEEHSEHEMDRLKNSNPAEKGQF